MQMSCIDTLGGKSIDVTNGKFPGLLQSFHLTTCRAREVFLHQPPLCHFSRDSTTLYGFEQHFFTKVEPS